MTPSAEQASKIWTHYERQPTEQNAFIDGLVRATKRYAFNFGTLGDSDTPSHVKALLERDNQLQALHGGWLAQFQTLLPSGTAARTI